MRRIGVKRWRRWAVFYIMVLLIAVTLIMTIRSGSHEDCIGLRYGRDPSGESRYLVLRSELGYLDLASERRGTGHQPIVFVETDDYVSAWRLGGIHYGYLLGAQCLVLFLLVPSVLARSGM